MFHTNLSPRGPTVPDLSSPNAIPPRTSSTGHIQNGINHIVTKPVLKPVPEGDWISQRKHSVPSAPSINPAIQPGGAPDPNKYYKNDMAFHGKGSWSSDKESVLLGPYDYLFAHPGKDIRSQLIAAFNEWLEVPPESLEIITKVVGMLHTASLLVDDVEDSSLLRRGLPVAHSIFGTAQTINSANYVYFLALQELGKLKNPSAVGIYTEELLNLHRGQGMDLFWRDTLTCPSEDDYLEMVGNKTGGLFRLAVKLMQAESKTMKYLPSYRRTHPPLTTTQRLRPPRKPHRNHLPNPRRLPKSLVPRIFPKQRSL